MANPIWKTDRWVYRPVIDGRQRMITSRIKGKRGADECKRKASSIMAGNDNLTVKFDQAWKEHVADREAHLGNSESLIKTKQIGRLYLLPRLKSRKVSQITDQQWQNCINLARSQKGTQLSKKTLQNIRAEIMLFCKFARKSGMITSMPIDLTIPRNAPTIGKEILSPDALRTLLADIDGDFYVNAWRLMVVTGLRPGECYGLQWPDVDNGMITVRRSINRRRKITSGKNKNAIRTMAQTKISSQIILAQRIMLAKAEITDKWVFPSPLGGMPSPSTIAKHWDNYRTKLGENVSLYGLRHTLVSIIKSEMPDALMKQLVGHAKSMDTIGVYGHEIDGDAEMAANILDEVFKRYIT